MRRQTSRSQRCLLALLAAIVMALGMSQLASAHARLLRSNPADGAVLTEAPSEIYLWFDEAIGVEFSSIEVLNADGESIDTLKVRGDPSDPTLLIATFPDLSEGIYSVAWQAWSNTDSHVTQGTLVFGIGVASEAAATTSHIESAISPVEAGLRTLNTLTLALMAGCLVVSSILRSTPAVATAAGERVWRTGQAATLGALVIGAGLLMWQTHLLGRDSAIELLGTRFGVLWLLRQTLLVLMMIALVTTQSGQRRGSLMAWFMLAALAVLQALNSHAAGLADRSVLAVSVDAAHQLAASVWVGSMLVLLITLLPLLRSRHNELSQIALNGWRRFGVIAAVSVGVLAVTGLYNAAQQVASIDAWISTNYGQLLSGKFGLFLIVGLCGLINSMLLHPRLAAVMGRLLHRPIGRTPLARSKLPIVLIVEAGVALLVFTASGILTSSEPARGPEFTPPSAIAQPPSSLSMPVDDLLVNLSIGPNKPGPNIATIEVLNTRRPAPADIIRVMVRLNYRERDLGTQTLIAEQVDDTTYRLKTSALSLAGDWRARVVVRRSGLEDSVADFAWQVEALPINVQSRPVVVSNAPLESVLTALAVLLAVCLLGIGSAAYWLRRRNPSRPVDSSSAFPVLLRSKTQLTESVSADKSV